MLTYAAHGLFGISFGTLAYTAPNGGAAALFLWYSAVATTMLGASIWESIISWKNKGDGRVRFVKQMVTFMIAALILYQGFAKTAAARLIALSAALGGACTHSVALLRQYTKASHKPSRAECIIDIASSCMPLLYGVWAYLNFEEVRDLSKMQIHGLMALTFIATMLRFGIYVQSHMPCYRSFMCVAMLGFHIFAVVGTFRIHNLPPSENVTRVKIIRDMAVLYFCGAFGITAGAHRLWSHRSYKANAIVRTFLMLCNSIALEGSILLWARDHRAHHRFSEKAPDPHNSLKGFFYAHMGWLLEVQPQEVVVACERTDISDLEKDPVVMFQYNLDPWFSWSISFLLPSLYAHFVYRDFWLGFFTLAALRWLITLHCTWCVNSVAHLWGPRPYNPNIGPVESFVTALLAAGEGWHNWHHQYAFDYATAEHGALRQYNPTKVFIDAFAWIGWVWDRKRATKLWEMTKRRQAERQRAALEALGGATQASCDEHPSESADEKKPLLSIQTLTDLIPKDCYNLSLLRSTAWLLRDVLAVVFVSAVTACIWVMVSRMRENEAYQSSRLISAVLKICTGVLFAIYSLAQGTVLMALWVAVYECAGGRFCRWQSLNGIIGAAISVALCIPYQGRRGVPLNKVHRRFPAAAHMCRALYEDVFSIYNVWRWTNLSNSLPLPIGGITAGVSLAILTALIKWTGWRYVACWYLGPWVVMNFWLLLYHHLLLVKVHRAFNDKHAINTSTSNENDDKLRTTEEILRDVVDDGEEAENTELPETLNVDPHSIKTLEQHQPLSRTSSEFFTTEWLLSAMEVFERTVLFRKTDSPPGGASHVRFIVRLLLFLFGSLHHHLTQINVLQSLDISIPHYHAREAVHALRLYIRAGDLLHQKAKEAAGLTCLKST